MFGGIKSKTCAVRCWQHFTLCIPAHRTPLAQTPFHPATTQLHAPPLSRKPGRSLAQPDTVEPKPAPANGSAGGRSLCGGAASRATVEESNVPEAHTAERVRRASERQRDNGELLPPLHSSKSKPNPADSGGFRTVLCSPGGGKRGILEPQVFFFFIFSFFSLPPPPSRFCTPFSPGTRIPVFSAVVCFSLSPQRWWSERSKWRSDRGRVPTIWCSCWTRRSSWRVCQISAASSRTWSGSSTKVSGPGCSGAPRGGRDGWPRGCLAA